MSESLVTPLLYIAIEEKDSQLIGLPELVRESRR